MKLYKIILLSCFVGIVLALTSGLPALTYSKFLESAESPCPSGDYCGGFTPAKELRVAGLPYYWVAYRDCLGSCIEHTAPPIHEFRPAYLALDGAALCLVSFTLLYATQKVRKNYLK